MNGPNSIVYIDKKEADQELNLEVPRWPTVADVTSKDWLVK